MPSGIRLKAESIPLCGVRRASEDGTVPDVAVLVVAVVCGGGETKISGICLLSLHIIQRPHNLDVCRCPHVEKISKFRTVKVV